MPEERQRSRTPGAPTILITAAGSGPLSAEPTSGAGQPSRGTASNLHFPPSKQYRNHE